MSQFFSPEHFPGALLLAILFIALGLILSWIVRKILRTALRHNQMARVDEITLSFLSHLAVLLIWILLATSYAHLIPALNKLGTAMLAGVSLASVIIGFAAQTTLGNLVSGISLVLYKPFRRGDRLQIQTPAGPEVGEVEDISLGYTILKTDDQRQIIVANSTMAQQTMIKLSKALDGIPPNNSEGGV